MSEDKYCKGCDSYKSIDNFAKDNRAKSGLQTRCKSCQKEYYTENRDRYRELKKKESYKLKMKEYFNNNKDSINEYKRQRYKTEEGKAKVKVNNRNRKDKIRSTSDGSITHRRILQLLKKQDYKCAISGVDIRDDYHIDHIIPLSKGGKHIDSNIQLLAPSVNMSKKDKIL